MWILDCGMWNESKRRDGGTGGRRKGAKSDLSCHSWIAKAEALQSEGWTPES
jgi:hypothetical protein